MHTIVGSRAPEEPDAPRLDSERPLLHGIAGTLLGFSNLMAISAHHGRPACPPRGWRATASPDVWLDWQLHPWDRLLFAARSQPVSP